MLIFFDRLGFKDKEYLEKSIGDDLQCLDISRLRQPLFWDRYMDSSLTKG
jgi:hypothetical protein